MRCNGKIRVDLWISAMSLGEKSLLFSENLKINIEFLICPQFMLALTLSSQNLPSAFHLFCSCHRSLFLTFFTHVMASVRTMSTETRMVFVLFT